MRKKRLLLPAKQRSHRSTTALGKSYPVSVRLNDFPFYRQVRVKAFVSDIRNEFLLKSDITRRAWDEMRRQGIRPPGTGMIVENTG